MASRRVDLHPRRTGAGRPPPPVWLAALPLALTAGLALLLGTVGYVAVGFGVLTGCTDESSCTETSCAPCDAASSWLGAGALGQLALVVAAVVALVVAVRRPASRRVLALAGWGALVVSAGWVVVSTAVAASTS